MREEEETLLRDKEKASRGTLNILNGILLLMMLLPLAEKEDSGLVMLAIFGAIGLILNLFFGIYSYIKKRKSVSGTSFLWFFVMLIITPVLAVAWFFLHFTKIGG